MTHIKHEIRIDAAKEKVWAAIADLGGVAKFNPAVKKSYYLSEQREGVGASRRCELRPFGAIDEKAIEWKDGESVTLEIFSGEKAPPFKSAIGVMSVEDVGDATVARLALDYELKYGVLGILMDRLLVRRQFKKMVPAILAGLKRHVEREFDSSNRDAA